MALKTRTNNSNTGESVGSKDGGRSTGIADELSLVESDEGLCDFVRSVEKNN